MIISAAYGEPVRLVCDRPACPAFVISPLVRGTDREQTRACRVLADAQGWDIARHGEVPFDFCPDHVDLANKPKVTELYPNRSKR